MLREDASGMRAASPASRDPGNDPGDHLIAALAANARDHGAAVAMRERDRGIWQETRWQDYLRQVLETAAGLEQLGVAPGDKVLVVGDNRPALYFGMLGAIALRAVPSPAYPDFTPEQLLGQLQREGVRFVIAEDQEQAPLAPREVSSPEVVELAIVGERIRIPPHHRLVLRQRSAPPPWRRAPARQ